MTQRLETYQREFIQFLVKGGVLTFGDFTLKSGRKAPYFINTGNFNDGEKIFTLGKFYAAHMMRHGLADAQVVFGPAYKGIPLAVGTASALYAAYGKNVGFAFDRKEAKDHGDGGLIVGRAPVDGDKVVLVEDVVTAGTTLQKIVPFLRKCAKIDLAGVVVSVDRCERGTGTLSAVAEAEKSLGVKVFPIVTIFDIMTTLDSDIRERIEGYLAEYGAVR